jgi:hypothetical protein
MTTTITSNQRLALIKERLDEAKQQMKEMNNNEHINDDTSVGALTSFSIGWDSALVFLAEQHGLDLNTLF